MSTSTADYRLKSPLLVGLGPWGRNIERVLRDLGVPPHLTSGRDMKMALEFYKPDSLIIATPVSTHYEILRFAHDADLPTFIEKPIVESVEQMRYLHQLWSTRMSPSILCDFTYCWSPGFEALNRKANGKHLTIDANFGGPGPIREDCHPVWDYGSHVVAMAIQLGMSATELQRAKLRKLDQRSFYLESDNFILDVGTNLDKRMRLVSVDEKFSDGQTRLMGTLRGSSWRIFGGGDLFYDDDVEQPLKRVLTSFLKLEDNDARWGLAWPKLVTEVLESWIPCNGRQATRLLTEETERLGGYEAEFKK